MWDRQPAAPGYRPHPPTIQDAYRRRTPGDDYKSATTMLPCDNDNPHPKRRRSERWWGQHHRADHEAGGITAVVEPTDEVGVGYNDEDGQEERETAWRGRRMWGATLPPTTVLNLAMLHGSVNWHLHCGCKVSQSVLVVYPHRYGFSGVRVQVALENPRVTCANA